MRVVGLVWGMTELDSVVYVVFDELPIVRTYSAGTLSSLGRDIHVDGMLAPRDIIACRDDRRLYIADSSSVWRVSVDAHADQEKWLSVAGDGKFSVDTLSLTSEHLLAMSKRQLPRLRQYRFDNSIHAYDTCFILKSYLRTIRISCFVIRETYAAISRQHYFMAYFCRLFFIAVSGVL